MGNPEENRPAHLNGTYGIRPQGTDAEVKETTKGLKGPRLLGRLLILDYDKSGNIVGVEILDASKRIENPRSLDYAVAG